MLPLYIFEDCYRHMLADVLEGSRIFAIAGQDEGIERQIESGDHQLPYSIATAGIIRASHENPDGTSNLILEGLLRVRLEGIMQEEPYRLVKVTPMPTHPGAQKEELSKCRQHLHNLIEQHRKLGGEVAKEAFDFLSQLEDTDTYADLAIFSLCRDSQRKQQLLETLETRERLISFSRTLQRENERLILENRLNGGDRDNDPSRN